MTMRTIEVSRKWVADQVWQLWNFDGTYRKKERKLHDEKNAGLIAAVIEVLRRAGIEVVE
jgi:hypothetical protein